MANGILPTTLIAEKLINLRYMCHWSWGDRPPGNLPKSSQANFHFTVGRGGALIEVLSHNQRGRALMSWTTPILVEVCIGLEINGYLPAEF